MNEANGAFARIHPVPAFVYFLCVLLIAMFSVNPVMAALSLAGGMLFSASLFGMRAFLKDLLFYLPLYLLLSLTNPLLSHNGVTPLFFLNGNPVTLEAILYGLDIAAVMVAVILWCRCFSAVMTSDKVFYLFGSVVPKLSLVLSMSLRFLPQLKRQWREIRDAQTAMGYYTEKGIVARIQGTLRVFSSLVGRALEGAVETGMSMRARGYGLRGRTHFSLFRFTREDGILLFTSAALACTVTVGTAAGVFDFYFYPAVTELPKTPVAVLLYGLFAVLCVFPCIFECEEALRWKRLRSTI